MVPRLASAGSVAPRVAHDARGEVQYFVQMFRDAADAFALEDASRRARERMEQARESCLRLVAEGYAEVTTFPPNVRYVDYYEAAERRARAAGLGLWGACGA